MDVFIKVISLESRFSFIPIVFNDGLSHRYIDKKKKFEFYNGIDCWISQLEGLRLDLG